MFASCLGVFRGSLIGPFEGGFGEASDIFPEDLEIIPTFDCHITGPELYISKVCEVKV